MLEFYNSSISTLTRVKMAKWIGTELKKEMYMQEASAHEQGTPLVKSAFFYFSFHSLMPDSTLPPTIL